MHINKSAFKQLLFVCFCLIISQSAPAQNLVIRGGWMFDSVGDKVVKVDEIVIKSGRFFSINGGKSNLDISGFEMLTLGENDFILPGIFDMHAHYRVTFNRIRRDETEANPRIFLANGVTSTYPAGEFNPEEMMELRKSINRGERPGPRIFNTGPYFGTAAPDWNRNTSPEDVYRIVDEWAEKGIGGLKAKGITAELLQALIDRGHMHGLTVSAHLGSGYRNTVNPRDAILMGLDRVEHYLGGDVMPATQSDYASLEDLDPNDPRLDSIMKMYIDHHVYFTATITAYGYYGDRKEGFDYWVNEKKYLTPFAREITKDTRQQSAQFDKIYKVKRKTIKRFYDFGGKHLTVLGTDHPSVGEYLAGFSAHRELEAFVLSGIPAADAIKMATINGARSLNVGDKLGSIEAGKLADLFVIKGNPLDNIRNTRTVHTVVKGGVVHNSLELLRSVEGILGPKNADDWK